MRNHILRILAFAFLIFSQSSFAAILWSGADGYVYDSPAAACASLNSLNTSAVRITNTNYGCYRGSEGPYQYTGSVGVCDASAVFDPVSGTCLGASPSCPPVGQQSGGNMEAPTTSLTTSICENGCGFDAAGAMGRNGKYFAFGPFTSTGACTPSSGDAPDPGERCSYRNPLTNKCEAACPTGQHYGQVPSGAMACIKADNSPPAAPKDKTCPYGYHNIAAGDNVNCAPDKPNEPAPDVKCPPNTVLVGSAPGYCKWKEPAPDAPTTAAPKTDSKTTGPTTTTNNADGSTTSTSSTTTSNSDGSKTTTTTTTTTKPDGTKTTDTTTTTGKKPGTEVDGKSDGTDADKTNFCKQNPTLTICQNSEVTQADCEATVCTGDAIQCAILRQNMKAYCDANAENDQSKFGAAMANGTDPLGSTLPNKANGLTVDFAATPITSTGFLGGGSCIADKSFTVSGMSVKLPFAQVCPYLIPMRAATMLAALLAAYFMLSGVILRT